MAKNRLKKTISFLVMLAIMAFLYFIIMPHMRVLNPPLFGQQHLWGNIFVDPKLTPTQKWHSYARVKYGQIALKDFFGSKKTQPVIIACATKFCQLRFGGMNYGQIDKTDLVELTQEDIASRYVVRYKLMKIELQGRLGSANMVNALPKWFEEGMATYFAGDPRYGKVAWYAYLRSRPKLRDVQKFKTEHSWQQAKRNNIPVKLLARQEFARWFDETGQSGLLQFLQEYKTGHAFKQAFSKQMQASLK